MKPNKLKYIWIIEDGYGDVQTEFFYPEKVAGKIPDTMGKDMHHINYMDSERECKAIRLKVEVVGPLHKESK